MICVCVPIKSGEEMLKSARYMKHGTSARVSLIYSSMQLVLQYACIRQAADGGKSMIGQKVTVCGWAGASTSRGARPSFMSQLEQM